MQACGLTEISPFDMHLSGLGVAAVWWLLQIADILSFLNSLRAFDCKTAIAKGCDILPLLIWQERFHFSVVLFLLFVLVSQWVLTGLQTLNPQLPRVTSFSNSLSYLTVSSSLELILPAVLWIPHLLAACPVSFPVAPWLVLFCVSQFVIARFSFSQSSLDTVYQLSEGSTMLCPSFSSWEHHTPRKSVVLNKDWLDTWMTQRRYSFMCSWFSAKLEASPCLPFMPPSANTIPPSTISPFISALKFCPTCLPTLFCGSCRNCLRWQSSYLLLRKPRQRSTGSRWFPRPRPVRELRDLLINKARTFPIAFHLRTPTVLREWLTLDILKL